MSTPTRADSEISFRAGAVPDQLKVTEDSGTGESSIQQTIGDMASVLKDVMRELQGLKEQRSPISAGSDQHAQHIVGSREPGCSQSQTNDQQDIGDAPYHTNVCETNSVGRDQTTNVGNANRNNRLHFSSQNTRNTDQNQSYDFPGRRPCFAQVKLPVFDGKEDWVTWITRFEVIADRYRWSEDDRLDQLLPKLEGLAADFAFSQLSPEVLNNYQELTCEMTNRFRVVETARSFAAKFSRRTQMPNERIEDFAADLKRLYDKAHGYRDRQTRDEDLVRRFLDGLHDEDARFELEFNKEPRHIDEAVYYAVNLIQIKSASRSVKRFISHAKRTYDNEDTLKREAARDGADSINVVRGNSFNSNKSGKKQSGLSG